MRRSTRKIVPRRELFRHRPPHHSTPAEPQQPDHHRDLPQKAQPEADLDEYSEIDGMTPDQLPPGLRVKALPWRDHDNHSIAVTDGPGLWYAFDTHATVPNPDGGFNLQIHATSRADAKEKAQQYRARQLCAQLEIEPGSSAVIPMPTAQEKAHQKDAQRYRWLRMNRLWLKANLPMIAAPQFDAAIDAALTSVCGAQFDDGRSAD